MDAWFTRAAELVAKLTLEEQATLLSGDGWWDTHAIERVGLPSIKLSDGPHGLRRARPGHSASTGESLPATCFPTASALAATWNTALVREVGSAIGVEAQAAGVHVLLAPGVNIKRSPLGGRNFEYFSEDPWLTGRLAVAFIDGVQAQGVGTSLKHFAVNSQETERMASDSVVDERTLREIYLLAFEMAVREAQPWTVMSAYNLVNGVAATEHHELLTGILRGEWGFSGFVVSDWGAVNDRVAAAAAGNNLEMPGSGDFNRGKLIAAVHDGSLAPDVVARAATEIVRVVLMAHASRRPETTVDVQAHHELARRAAAEAIVLLRNEDAVLPLARGQQIAVIGAYARQPRHQGAGSSHVNPYRLTCAWDALEQHLGEDTLAWAEGFNADGEATDIHIQDAVALARRADVAVLFVGLPDSFESEAFDRQGIDLPASQNQLIEAVAAVQPRTVVVLHNGSGVAMPWLARVQAVVEAWLGGQAVGDAVADVLTGHINPSGKLAETFAARLCDTAPHPNFPGRGRVARYGEGLFVGYRHHDAHGIPPLFPFGFGLSYTSFKLDKLRVGAADFDVRTAGEISVLVDITNTGDRVGQEVVQLYLHAVEPRLPRPPLELRAFDKVELAPGQTGTVRFRLTPRDFAHWDLAAHAWRVDSGRFEIHVGTSSRELPLRQPLQVQGDAAHRPVLTRQSFIGDFLSVPGGDALYAQLVRALGFGSIMLDEEPPTSGGQQALDWEKRRAAMTATANALPVGKLPAFSEGRFDDAALEEILCRAAESISRS